MNVTRKSIENTGGATHLTPLPPERIMSDDEAWKMLHDQLNEQTKKKLNELRPISVENITMADFLIMEDEIVRTFIKGEEVYCEECTETIYVDIRRKGKKSITGYQPLIVYCKKTGCARWGQDVRVVMTTLCGGLKHAMYDVLLPLVQEKIVRVNENDKRAPPTPEWKPTNQSQVPETEQETRSPPKKISKKEVKKVQWDTESSDVDMDPPSPPKKIYKNEVKTVKEDILVTENIQMRREISELKNHIGELAYVFEIKSKEQEHKMSQLEQIILTLHDTIKQLTEVTINEKGKQQEDNESIITGKEDGEKESDMKDQERRITGFLNKMGTSAYYRFVTMDIKNNTVKIDDFDGVDIQLYLKMAMERMGKDGKEEEKSKGKPKIKERIIQDKVGFSKRQKEEEEKTKKIEEVKEHLLQTKEAVLDVERGRIFPPDTKLNTKGEANSDEGIEFNDFINERRETKKPVAPETKEEERTIKLSDSYVQIARKAKEKQKWKRTIVIENDEEILKLARQPVGPNKRCKFRRIYIQINGLPAWQVSSRREKIQLIYEYLNRTLPRGGWKDFSLIGRSVIEVYVAEPAYETTIRALNNAEQNIIDFEVTKGQDNVPLAQRSEENQGQIIRRLVALVKRNPLSEMQNEILRGWPQEIKEAVRTELKIYLKEMRKGTRKEILTVPVIVNQPVLRPYSEKFVKVINDIQKDGMYSPEDYKYLSEVQKALVDEALNEMTNNNDNKFTKRIQKEESDSMIYQVSDEGRVTP